MLQRRISVFMLLVASTCGCVISKTHKAITIDELKEFTTKHHIQGLVARLGNSDARQRLKINSLPTILVVNDKLEIVYKHTGYSSNFKKDLKEAIDCNTIFCALDSNYVKTKSKYSGMYINDLMLKDLSGNSYQLSTLIKENSIAVIDFWASWCKPCLSASKSIAELYKEYKDKDVAFIAINVDKIENR